MIAKVCSPPSVTYVILLKVLHVQFFLVSFPRIPFKHPADFFFPLPVSDLDNDVDPETGERAQG